jgi:hypothetical protein
MCISNTDWFMSYLKGRQQTVSVDNILSEYMPVAREHPGSSFMFVLCK